MPLRMRLSVPSLPSFSNLESKTLQREKFEHQKAKDTVASLINSYNTAKSGAMRDYIVRSMRNYYGSLDTNLRRAVDPYIAHGPTSPMAEKEREFIKHNPPPDFPLYEDGDNVAVQTHRINYLFKQADWERKRQAFLFGSDVAGDKQNFIGLPDGLAAIRNKQGQIMVLSQGDLQLKEMSEKYNIPVKDIVIHGGVIPTGKTGVLVSNGWKITTEGTLNLFADDPKERYGIRIVDKEPAPKSAWDIDHPARLQKFLLDWKAEDTENESVKSMRELADKNPKIAEIMLGETFPQYSFRVVKRKTNETRFKRLLNILPFVSANVELALIPIRGKPIPLEDAKGFKGTFYYDSGLDLVSNEYGIPLGSYEQVANEIATRDLRGGK